ncbi:aminotransferase class V-fold PLP-dependent enzyme [Actinotalea sp. K2]|uniref:aminotransferase class V-fold PLP-dependent enzyme n=1 Tax=Actinotalea sp. K2 TaxID=2939438 RepID=UPI002017F217|nr:aminotransferase class V-fold PLP-dependent enzyme [Actinotalea sp. K2]MCL3861392.1 aminotransferase class V-fold PLP-dependent enzyme [Actinotalea sp. K2]
MTTYADQWSSTPGYLNAASMGLPPRGVLAALQATLTGWQAGTVSAPGFDADVHAARTAFARLVGVDVGRVAVGPQVSTFMGLVASALPDGARVVCPTGEFTSVTFPFMVHADRGLIVEHVPLDALAEAVRPGVDVVAFSLVQSADGALADADAVVRAAREVGALVVVDLTQAAGWLPVDASAFDITVTGAYKWLCAPRGSAFLTISEEAGRRLRPLHAGWYAGESVWESVYGPRMQLAADARRFDVSPAWIVWAGTAPALGLFADLMRGDPSTAQAVRRHGADLADLVRAELGLEPTGLPILSLPDPDGAVLGRLTAAGCTAAARAGGVRLAFHLWNDQDDVDRVVSALGAGAARPEGVQVQA